MCPHCKSEMVIFEFEGIEIDHCMECRGTWFDATELEHLNELAGVEPGRLTEALLGARKGKVDDLPCPCCKRPMRAVHVSDELVLDECPLGKGIWFDQGEIRRFIEIFHEGEAGAVAAFLADLLKSELASPN